MNCPRFFSSSGLRGCAERIRLRGVVMARLVFIAAAIAAVATGVETAAGGRDGGAGRIDELLAASSKDSSLTPAPLIDDTVYLRRATIDLVGRIPTVEEHRLFFSEPTDARRRQLVDRLVASDRFADRWAVWLGEMLRVRNDFRGGIYPTGGPEFDRFVRQSMRGRMPYDELVRQLLTAKGTPAQNGAVGLFAANLANPLEMTSAVAQTLLGIRMKCARCHDHPTDRWTQREYHELSAFFGDTRWVGSQTIPARVADGGGQRMAWPPRAPFVSVSGHSAEFLNSTPLEPAWPLPVAEADDKALAAAIDRVRRMREPTDEQAIDDLLVDAIENVSPAGGLAIEAGVVPTVAGELRRSLADRLTDPRNRFFARNLVNRLWATLVGRGLVEPVDDFRDDNPPRHPELLDHLANELVSSGHDISHVVKIIVSSDAYARGHSTDEDPVRRRQLEDACLATPPRLLPPEALHDSIALAGHVHEVKHPPGANLKTVETRVLVQLAAPAEAADGKEGGGAGSAGAAAQAAAAAELALALGDLGGVADADDDPAMGDISKPMQGDAGGAMMQGNAGGATMKGDAMKGDAMKGGQAGLMMKGDGAGEPAPQSLNEKSLPTLGFKTVTSQVDFNPHFPWAIEMPLPAPHDHFLRLLGQSPRRDQDASEVRPDMRQALAMINGPLVHEAARVGPLEPLGRALALGGRQDLVGMLYMETLSREPTTEERAGAEEVVASAASAAEGIADLRWAIFNCREFRFIP